MDRVREGRVERMMEDVGGMGGFKDKPYLTLFLVWFYSGLAARDLVVNQETCY